MVLPGGSEWWKANGEAMNLSFDLADGSPSWQILEAYLQAQGFSLVEKP